MKRWKRRWRGLQSQILLILLLMGLCTGARAETEPSYTYLLICKRPDATTITMDLHLRPQEYSGHPLIDSAGFALKFPEWMGEDYSFTPGERVQITNMVPEKRYPAGGEIRGGGYHAFYWYRQPWVNQWDLPNSTGIFVGSYTFHVEAGVNPAKTAVGIMNWLETAESVPLEYENPAARPQPSEDPFNGDIWNDETGLYLGTYAKEGSAEMIRTDIGFRLTAPEEWKNAFTFLSYDPKKPATVELWDEKGEALVADGFDVPIWDSGGGERDGDTLFSKGAENRDTGIGAYVAAVEMDSLRLDGQAVQLVSGKGYKLMIKKPGHLTVKLEIRAKSGNLFDAEGLPAFDKPLYLPVGDLNEDGKIKLNDRSMLMAYLNRQEAVGQAEEIWDADIDRRAYLADINGDGRISLPDLSILMAAENYNREEG